MFCKNCGSELQNGANFCPKCGTSLSADAVNSAAPSQVFDEGKTLVSKMGSAEGNQDWNTGLVDGKIILSENALIFQPRFYQIGSDRIVMPLLDIQDIVKENYMFVFSNKMKINLRSGVSYTLIFMTGRDVFINALEQQIRLVGGNSNVL
jgi:hypothetical protein